MEWSAYLHLLLHAILIGYFLFVYTPRTHFVFGFCVYIFYCVNRYLEVFKMPIVKDLFNLTFHTSSFISSSLYMLKSHDIIALFVCLLPGFDHQHPEVYEHCKRLLLHLLIVQGANGSVQSVAMVLLRNRDYNEPRVLTVKPVAPEFNLTGQFYSGAYSS